METLTDITLKEALNAACCTELPKELSSESGFWLKAIALVRKVDGNKTYALVTQNHNGKINISVDFGTMSRIISIEKIYPYLVLDADKYIPHFKNKEEVYYYLITGYGKEFEDDIKRLDNDSLKALLRKMAISQQLGQLNDRTLDDVMLGNKAIVEKEIEEEKKNPIAVTIEETMSIVKKRKAIKTTKNKRNGKNN